MGYLAKFVRIITRLFFTWALDAIGLYLVSEIYPGLKLMPTSDSNQLEVAAAVALLIGIINFTARPLFLFLMAPFGMMAVFLTGFVINALVLKVAGSILPNLVVSTWMDAAVGAFLLAAMNTVLNAIFPYSDEESFSNAIIEHLASKNKIVYSDHNKRGLLMIEIDGASYWHILKAIKDGKMPVLSRFVEKKGYRLTKVDCGLPSQTSACQAGILFGENSDIPAFRWYIKESHKLIVSSSDAGRIEQQISHGQGLLSGGTSIGNMLDGDASVSLFTLSNLASSADSKEHRQRAADVYLLMIHPYFFMRSLVFSLLEILLELGESLVQLIRNIKPRMNRLTHFYPFVRPAETILLRDMGEYLTGLEIYRGSPVIYWSFVGYDEVAHHSGPWSADAMRTLHRFDKVIGRLEMLIDQKAPISYDLILLSDHGQSNGATFRQRYGYSITSFIRSLLPRDVEVIQVTDDETDDSPFLAIQNELENVQQQRVHRKRGGLFARWRENRKLKQLPRKSILSSDVTVCCSGNLAQIYFCNFSDKITLEQIEAVSPGLVDRIASHEGIGFVAGVDSQHGPVIIGKRGKRNLLTGEVKGEDPLSPYGEVEVRAAQLARLLSFEHAGDLILNSTLYPDGSVAAMEELVGCHGGIGGEQTDAFLLTPAGMEVPEIHSSTEVYSLLKQRRNASAAAAPAEHAMQIAEPQPVKWHFPGWRAAFGSMNQWGEYFLRAAFLDRKAYQQIANEPELTLPGVLIGMLGNTVHASFLFAGFNGWAVAGALGGWLVMTWLIFITARWVGGKGSWGGTLRVTGYAHSVFIFDFLVYFKPIQTIMVAFTSIFFVIGCWIGVAQVHRLRGVRNILFPLAVVLVLVFSVVSFEVLLNGGELTFRSLKAFLLHW